MRLPLKRSRSVASVAVLALMVVGCAQNGSQGPAAQGGDAVVAPISDPVVAFAASGAPGAEEAVVLPSTGQTARVRMVRAYAAASGRDCREILVRTDGSTQTRLICRAGNGWREARPLIQDASARP